MKKRLAILCAGFLTVIVTSILSSSSVSAVPAITSISPNQGSTAGGDSISITGTGFTTTGSSVTIDGASATITNATTTVLTVTTPAGSVGPANVVVRDNASATTVMYGGFIYTDGTHLVNTWTGTTSIAWAVGTNWSRGAPPSTTDIVAIEGTFTNQPALTMASPLTIYALTIGVTGSTANRTLTVGGSSNTNTLTITGDTVIGKYGVLTHTTNTTTQVNSLVLSSSGDFAIAASGSVNLASKGYSAGNGPGGGAGGVYTGAISGSVKPAYGSIRQPTDLGSGGTAVAGAGGGAFKLTAGTVTIDGTLNANGGNGASGGSVWINSTTFAGAATGSITANTASTSYTATGGRIAVHASSASTYAGTMLARGGLSAATGTIFTEYGAGANGNLTIDGGAVDTTTYATSEMSSTETYDNLKVTNGGRYSVANGQTVTVANAPLAAAGSTVTTRGQLSLNGTLNVPNNSTLTNYNVQIGSDTAYSDKNPIIGSGSDFEPTFTNTTGSAWTLDSLTIQSGGNLTHPANTTTQASALNVSVTNTFNLQSGGTVDISSKGYSTGNGPGGGAHAVYTGSVSGSALPAYGSIRQPTDLGSGGTTISGSGGGAFKLTAGTVTLDGTINANGGSYSTGGSVWISASTFGGAATGTITANTATSGYIASGGRIAVYAPTNTYAGTLVARGGATSAAGTIFTKYGAQTNGNLTVDNASIDSGIYATTEMSSTETYDNLKVTNGGRYGVANGQTVTVLNSPLAAAGSATTTRGQLTLNGTLNVPNNSTLTNYNVQIGSDTAYSDKNPIIGSGSDFEPTFTNTTGSAWTLDSLTIQNGGNLTHPANTTTQANALNVAVTNGFDLQTGGTVDLLGKGYSAGNGPGGGPSAVYTGAASNSVKSPYGSIRQPTDLGSGGTTVSGAGGGAFKLTAGTATVNGVISVNGSGYGTGGSVWINASTFTGGGTINSYTSNTSYIATGGRIAIYAPTDTFAGILAARSGASSAAGTIFTKTGSQTNGTLTVDNSNLNATTYNTAEMTNGETYDFIKVTNGGRYAVASGQTVTVLNSPLAAAGSALTTRGQLELVGTLVVPAGSTLTNYYVYHNSTTFNPANLIIGSGTTYELHNTNASTPWNISSGLTVASGGTLTSTNNTTVETYTVNVRTTGNLVVESGGAISVDGKGYIAQNGPGAGTTVTSGGSYGGLGVGTTGGTYGSNSTPVNIGSGAGGTGGAGGGAIKLRSDTTIDVSGTVSANGAIASSLGGSGGSVLLIAGALAGDGTISAKGGTTTYGGGGGRIAAQYPSGLSITPPLSVVSGGIGGGDVTRLSGSNISPSATILFGNSSAQFTADVSGATISTPSQTSPGPVNVSISQNQYNGSVTVAQGSATAGNGTTYPVSTLGEFATINGGYTYIVAPPTVTSVTPAFGPQAGGTKVQISGSNFIGQLDGIVTTGYSTTCGIKTTTQTAYCWGRNDEGQVGDGSSTSRNIPTAVSTSGALSGKQIAQISTGGYSNTGFGTTCALTTDNGIYCWGSNAGGHFGNGNATSSNVPVATNMSGALAGKTIRSISSGGLHACAVSTDNHGYCWGWNTQGQVGDNSITARNTPVEIYMAGALSGKTIKKIVAGNLNTCAIASDDKAYCWGYNANGAAGDGTSAQRNAPVAVSTAGVLSGKSITDISLGSVDTPSTTCALDSGGKVYCWGLGTSGQLGNGVTGSSTVPVAVDTSGVLSGKTVAKLSTGGLHSCVVTTDHTVACWGGNASGQLGNGGATLSNIPVNITSQGVLSGKTILSTSAGMNHTCAVASDQSVSCWGLNAYGQLGTANTTASNIPVSASNFHQYLTGTSIGVKFGVTDATSINYVSPSLIEAYTPASATIGFTDVTVTNIDSQFTTLSQGFEYTGVPSISSVVPNNGSPVGGDTVVVSGQHFRTTPTVYIGGQQVPSGDVTFNYALQTITILTPASPGMATGAVNVRVVNPDTLETTLVGGFTYNAAPTLTSLSSTGGKQAGGDTITLTGTNFMQGPSSEKPRVFFGVVEVSSGNVTYTSATSLQAVVPAAASAGSVNVHVTNPDGQSSNTTPYTYYAPMTVTNASPNAVVMAGGTEVTINGTNFDGTSRLYIDGAEVTIASRTATTLVFTAPAHALADVDVRVTSDLAGEVTKTQTLLYVPDAYNFQNSPLVLHATEVGMATVEPRDILGNILTLPAGYSLTLALQTDSLAGAFSLDGTSGWGATEITMTAGQSSANVYYKDAERGTHTITVTGPANVSASQQVDISTRYSLLVTGVSDPVTAGVPSSITVQGTDWLGNVMPDYMGTVDLSSTDRFATIPGQFTIANGAEGRATFTNGVTMVINGEQCVSAVDISDANISGQQCAITVENGYNGAATKLAVITSPRTTMAQIPTDAITVQAQDVDGNPVPMPVNVPIYLTVDSDTASYSLNGLDSWQTTRNLTITIPQGASSASFYLKDDVAGTRTVQMRDQSGVTDTGFTDTSQQVSIVPYTAANLVVTSAPQTIGITQSSAPITVTYTDADGQPLNALSDTTIYVTTDSPTGWVSADGTNWVRTSVSTTLTAGTSAVNVYYKDDERGSKTLAITDQAGALDINAVDTTHIVTVNAPSFNVTSAPQTIDIRTPSAPITVQLRDIDGSPMTRAQDTTLYLTTGTTTGQFSSDGTSGWAPTTATDQSGTTYTPYTVTLPAGQSQVSFYYKDSERGTPQLTITDQPSRTTDVLYVDATHQVTVTAPQITLSTHVNPATQFAGDSANAVDGTSSQLVYISQPSQAIRIKLHSTTQNADITAPETSTVYVSSDDTDSQISLDGVTWHTTIDVNNPTRRLPLAVTLPQGTDHVDVYFRGSSATAALPAGDTLRVVDQPYGLDPDSGLQTYTDSYGYTDSIDAYTVAVAAWPIDHYTLTVPQPTYYQAWYTVSLSLRDRCETAGDLCPYTAVNGRPTLAAEGDQVIRLTPADSRLLLQHTDNSTSDPFTVTVPQGSSSVSFKIRGNEIFQTDLTAHEDAASSPVLGVADTVTPIDIAARPVDGITLSTTAVAKSGSLNKVTATLKNDLGDTVVAPADFPMTLTATDGQYFASTDTSLYVTSITIPAGQSSVDYYYRSTTTGTKTLQATKGGMTGTAMIVLAGEAAVAYSLLAPTDIPVSLATQLTYATYDIYGNVTAVDADTQAVFTTTSNTGTFAPTSTGTWSPSLTVTLPNGSSTTPVFYKDTTLDRQATLSVNDTVATMAGDTMDVTIVGQTVSSLQFQTSPQTVEAGNVSGAITVRAMRADGQPAVVGSDYVVTLSTNSTGDATYRLTSDAGAASTLTATIPKGSSSVTVYHRDTRSGTHQLMATGAPSGPGADLVALQDIIITSAAPAALTVTSAPQDVQANAPSDAIQFKFLDAFGNIATARSNMTVDLSSDCGDSQFSATATPWSTITNTLVTTGSNGGTVYFKTASASCLLTIASSGLTSGTQTLTTYPGAASMSLTPVPTTAQYGQPVDVTLHLYDRDGNIVTQVVAQTIKLHTSAGSAPALVTVPAGSSSTTFTYTAPTSGTSATITAYDELNYGDADAGIANTSTDVQVVPGVATKLAVTPTPSNVVAGESKTLTVHLKNAYNADVIALSDTTVDLTHDGSGNFTATSPTNAPAITTVTIPQNSATATVYYHQDAPGLVTIGVDSTGLTSGAAQLTVVLGDIARYEILDVPSTAVAGETKRFQVVAYDSVGNRVNFPSGYVVYLATSSTTSSFGGSMYESASHLVRAPFNNTAGLTFTYTDTVPGSYTLTAGDSFPIDAPDQTPTNGTANLDIVWGQPDHVVLTGNLSGVYRGSVSPVVTATLYNAHGLVMQAASDFSVPLNSSSTTGLFAASASGPWDATSVTIAAGQSTGSFYYKDPSTLGVFMLAAYPPTTPATTATLSGTILLPKPSYLQFVTTPQTIIATHPSNTITLASFDEFGIPTPFTDDHMVTLSSSSGTGQFALAAPNWGTLRFQWPNGALTSSFIHRDETSGVHALSARADGLVTPGSDNALFESATVQQPITIVPQVMDHFVVTNISDPQVVNTATSIFVIAQDPDNYAVPSYDGTIHFTTSDSLGSVPADYTFVPPTDRGSHTFVNGALFRTTGEQTVSIADTVTGLSGRQTAITVLGATTNCPSGSTGTYPDCKVAPKTCPAGTTGVYPSCKVADPVKPPTDAVCPAGTTGTPPNCLTPEQQKIIKSLPQSGSTTGQSGGNIYDGSIPATVQLLEQNRDPFVAVLGVAAVALLLWDMLHELRHVHVYMSVFQRQQALRKQAQALHLASGIVAPIEGVGSWQHIRSLYLHPLFWVPFVLGILQTVTLIAALRQTGSGFWQVLLAFAVLLVMSIVYSILRNKYLHHENVRVLQSLKREELAVA